MKYLGLAVTIFAAFSANLQAAGIIACYDGINGDPTVLRGTACASQPSFSTMAPTDFLDWSALGGALNNTYDPTAHAGASWQAVTNGGMTVGLNVGPGFTGNPTLAAGRQWVSVQQRRNLGSGARYARHHVRRAF